MATSRARNSLAVNTATSMTAMMTSWRMVTRPSSTHRLTSTAAEAYSGKDRGKVSSEDNVVIPAARKLLGLRGITVASTTVSLLMLMSLSWYWWLLHQLWTKPATVGNRTI